MSGKSHNKFLPSTPPTPPRPSIKRSLTSMMASLSRKPSRGRAPRKAASWDENWDVPSRPTRVRIDPEPRPWTIQPRTEIVESGGTALADAQDAFTNSKRAVWTRILWTFPSEHDTRAQMVLSKVESKGVAEGLASFGVRNYLETGRGAIFCNAYHNTNDSSKIVVDWVTFRDTQKTRDKMLQQDLLSNDPATSVLVYVFRISTDKRSVAIWRKRIPLPSNISGRNATAISARKRELKPVEEQYVIKISPANEDMPKGSGLRSWASLTRRGVRA